MQTSSAEISFESLIANFNTLTRLVNENYELKDIIRRQQEVINELNTEAENGKSTRQSRSRRSS